MITRPISKSISRGIALAINDPNGAWFDPLSLFAAGEQGAWYDPSDMSSLFQDAAGTIPVTAAGQPVGMMRDKSGRGNHATQATATSRPILQTTDGKWYLAFDGVDDGMLTSSVDFTVTDKMTVWAGLKKISDAAIGIVCELSGNAGANNGTFVLYAPYPSGAGAGYAMASKATTLAIIERKPIVAPHTAVLTGEADIAASSISLRVNGGAVSPVVTTQGAGTYGNYPMYIGKRNNGTLPVNGNFYGLIVRGANSTAEQIAGAEAYMNSKAGAY